MKELTERQRQVLDFIRAFGERHGVPPTVREIGEKFGFTARAAFDPGSECLACDQPAILAGSRQTSPAHR